MPLCVDLSACIVVDYEATDWYQDENSWSITDTDGNILAQGEDYDGLFGNGCISGCTDTTAENYYANPDIVDNSLCEYALVQGCTDASACNYDPAAEQDNGSCELPAAGLDCAGNCLSGVLLSMSDSYGDGWNGAVLTINGVDYTVAGSSASACVDLLDCNAISWTSGSYDSETSWSLGDLASGSFGSGAGAYGDGCISGCTDSAALNFVADASIDDGSCQLPLPCPAVSFDFVNTGVNMTLFAPNGAGLSGTVGAFVGDMCIGSSESNGGPLQIAIMGDDTDSPELDGALEGELVTLILQNSEGVYVTATSFQYSLNSIEVVENLSFDYSCTGTQDIVGCMDGHYLEYDPAATVNDYDLCLTWRVFGCTDSTAANYSEIANVDDGSCIDAVPGCTDALANNYSEIANVDDGSCTYDVMGCTDEQANNYNSEANVDDDSCEYDDNNCGCTDPNYLEYYTQGYFAICSNNSCETPAQNAGLSPSSFNQPLNTSINLTLGLEINNLFIPNGTQVAAFYDLNQDGIINTNPLVTSSGQVYYECVGLTDYETSFFAMAIWGDDPLTEEVDGVPNGAENLLFALLTPDQSVVLFDIIPDQFTYSPNGLYAINEINLSPEISGCTT